MLDTANQQATIGSFTGILEGEGSFHGSKGTQVRISNSDPDIILACESFLTKQYIWYTTSNQKRDGKKKEYTIYISNSRNSVFQYATILYKSLGQSLQCRHSEYESLIGASTTTRDLTIDKDWMTGIYEAEGSFSLLMNHRGVIVCNIKLGNTNKRIITKIERNLSIMQCAYHIRDKIPIKDTHKPSQEVEIHGMKRCRRFLEAMYGRWISTKNNKRASLMLQYINTRLSHSFKDPYTEKELRIMQAICDINSQ